MIISINAGHTIKGIGSGAVGIINESEHTRILKDYVIKLLKSYGHTVYDSTVDYAQTVNESLSKIVDKVNNKDIDLFVSIHFNAFNGNAQGTEIFTYKGKKLSEAENVLKNICDIGFNNRGIKDGSNLYVIRNTDCASMLIEVCFCDNAKDVDKYLDNVEKIAEAIAKGINCNKIENTSYKSEFEEARQKMIELGVTDGSEPKRNITREEAFTMLYRLYNKLK